MGLLYPAPRQPGKLAPTSRSFASILLAVLAVHVGLGALLAWAVPAGQLTPVAQLLHVRVLEQPPERKQAPPPPPVAKPQPPRRPPPAPPPLLAVAAPVADSAIATFTVPPPPAAPSPTPAEPPAPPPPAPAALTPARFDAGYLNNPPPRYPPLSRRLGEEGKVVLRVQLDAGGLPESIAIATSSGFQRLDEAARSTVSQWRFVPARRGAEAVAASVLVPILFKLES